MVAFFLFRIAYPGNPVEGVIAVYKSVGSCQIGDLRFERDINIDQFSYLLRFS